MPAKKRFVKEVSMTVEEVLKEFKDLYCTGVVTDNMINSIVIQECIDTNLECIKRIQEFQYLCEKPWFPCARLKDKTGSSRIDRVYMTPSGMDYSWSCTSGTDNEERSVLERIDLQRHAIENRVIMLQERLKQLSQIAE